MIRMLIVGYCSGLRSERRFTQEVELHLAYRWFCRLDLDDKVPHHSTFSENRLHRFRESDVFWRLFEGVVAACMAAGLIKGEGFWAIRTRLQIERQARDLALFNLAIDSKLRGCDVVAIRVEDVAPNGHAIERATVRQIKTGRPVRFELTEQTRQAIDEYLAATGKKPGDHLFSGRRPCRSMTTRQYARLLSDWLTANRA